MFFIDENRGKQIQDWDLGNLQKYRTLSCSKNVIMYSKNVRKIDGKINLLAHFYFLINSSIENIEFFIIKFQTGKKQKQMKWKDIFCCDCKWQTKM